MPRDINGNTSPLPGTLVNTGDTVLPSQHNPMVNDVYAMMSQSLSRDGQGGMRAPLDMGTRPINNLAAGTLSTDAATVGQLSSSGVPVGSVISYAGSTAPPSWALAFGQAISRAAFPDLFAAIGTTYGAGDGVSTFNLPDLRGRVEAGKDNMGGTAAGRLTGNYLGSVGGTTLGATGGEEAHVVTVAEMPSHGHGFVGNSLPPHAHGYLLASNFGAAGPGGYARAGEFFSSTEAVSAGTPSGTVLNNGSNYPHNTVQPTMILNKIIKVMP